MFEALTLGVFEVGPGWSVVFGNGTRSGGPSDRAGTSTGCCRTPSIIRNRG